VSRLTSLGAPTAESGPPRGRHPGREHLMNTTYQPQSPSGVGSLKKSCTRAVLVGAVALAVLALGAGTATAKPGPEPTLICPTSSVTAGTNGTVTLANDPGTAVIVIADPNNFQGLNDPNAGNPPWGVSPVPGGYLINVTWPQGPNGPHQIVAAYILPGQSATGPGGDLPDRAYCTIQLNNPASAPAPPPPGSAGGPRPAAPPACPSAPPSSCASDPGRGPIQRQQ